MLKPILRYLIKKDERNGEKNINKSCLFYPECCFQAVLGSLLVKTVIQSDKILNKLHEQAFTLPSDKTGFEQKFSESLILMHTRCLILYFIY